jgi:hypothetical protein
MHGHCVSPTGSARLPVRESVDEALSRSEARTRELDEGPCRLVVDRVAGRVTGGERRP